MNDNTLTDMTPFLARQDSRTQHLFIALLFASLMVSALTFMRGVLDVQNPGAIRSGIWFPIVVYPLLIVVFWCSIKLWQRKQPKPPGGRYLMNADDARNTARVANTGFVFTTGFGLVMIASQAGIALRVLGTPGLADSNGDWMGRAVLIALGCLAIYMGNVWPKMPASRAPQDKPATQMKYNRLGGWLNVMVGVAMAVPALFLPLQMMVPAITAVSLLSLAATAMFVIRYRRAMKA